jgi:hypothetical protein
MTFASRHVAPGESCCGVDDGLCVYSYIVAKEIIDLTLIPRDSWLFYNHRRKIKIHWLSGRKWGHGPSKPTCEGVDHKDLRIKDKRRYKPEDHPQS